MNDVELERLLGFNVDQAHKLTIKCMEENASLMEKVKNLENKLDKSRSQLKKFSKWIFFFQMLSFQNSSCDRSGLWFIKMGSFIPYSHLHHGPLLVMKENNLYFLTSQNSKVIIRLTKFGYMRAKDPIAEVQVPKPKSKPSPKSSMLLPVITKVWSHSTRLL